MTKSYLKNPSKFNNLPVVEVKNEQYRVVNGWSDICARLSLAIHKIPKKKRFVIVETYQGVIHEELIANLQAGLKPSVFINASDFMLSEE